MNRYAIRLLLALTLCQFLSNAFANGWAVEPTTFPSFNATSLKGKSWQVPANLSGQKNILIVAFTDKKQPEIDSWFSPLRALQANHPGLEYYEIPVLPEKYAMSRPFIDRYMRGKVPSANTQERVLPWYTNIGEFVSRLKIDNQQDIRLYLVDRAGKVLHQTSGAYSENKLKAFREKL